MFRIPLRLGSFFVMSLLVAAGCSKPVFVDIADAGDAGVDSGVNNPCDFTTGVGCGGGLDCVRHLQTGGVLTTTCEIAGTLGEGLPCNVDAECAVGSICVSTNGPSYQKTCHVLCDVTLGVDPCPNYGKGSVCAFNLAPNGGSNPTPGTLNGFCSEACTPSTNPTGSGCTSGVGCLGMVGIDADGGVPIVMTYCSVMHGTAVVGDSCDYGADCALGLVCYREDTILPGTCRLPCQSSTDCVFPQTCDVLPSAVSFGGTPMNLCTP